MHLLDHSVHKGCAKLPLLVDGKSGFELWDAHAIMGYLADKYAPPPARAQVHLPEDTTGKAKVRVQLSARARGGAQPRAECHRSGV